MPLNRILATKLLAPRIGAGLVLRPRMLELWEGYQNKALTLLSAPAGYGKTVLAAQLSHQARWPVCWYHLDRFDNDLALFVQHLTAGITRQLPGFGAEVTELVEQSRDLPGEMRRLIAAMVNGLAACLEDGLILIIDDYHSIREPSVHMFMDSFLEYLPERVHVVLCSRTVPPLKLAKLKLAGLMQEIGADELKFNRAEIARFLVQDNGDPISGDIVALLEKETGGWPAALRLSATALAGLKGRRKEAAARVLPRREIYQYLATEVLQSLPQELYEFMLATSVFEIMTPELCNRLLGRDDSRQVLKTIEDQHLFITVLEGQEDIYRYHHLFREVLRSRLGDNRANLARTAGRCYLEAGYPVRAVETLIEAGDYEAALQAVEQVGSRMLRQNRWQTVRRWLQGIPVELKEKSAWITLFEASVALRSGNTDQAGLLTNKAEAGFEALSDQDGLLQARLNQARILRLRGHYDAGLKLLHQILPGLSQQPVASWYDAALERASLLGLRGDPEPAVRLLKKALQAAEREGEMRITAQLTEMLVDLYYLKGDYGKAVEVHQRAVEMAPEPERMSYALRDPIAMIYRDWGDLEQAKEYAINSIKTKEELGMVEALPFAYHQMAVIAADLGNYDEAASYFKRSIDLTRELGGDSFFLALSLILYGRLLAGQGEMEKGFSLAGEALAAAREQSDFIHAICLQAAAPLFAQRGRLEDGEEMLRQAAQILEEVGAKYPLCLAYGEAVSIHYRRGEEDEAREAAARCLKLAAAEYYMQLFLSNREIMLPVVKSGLIHGIEVKFVSEIVERLGEGSFAMLVELAAHGDPAVRRRAIGLLARTKSPEAEPVVQAALSDPDEAVRDQALAVLQHLPRPTGSEDVLMATAAPPEKRLVTQKVSPLEAGPLLEVQCLGPFRVLTGETEITWRTTKARDLFAYLVHHRDRPVFKENILEDLWPETDPEHASTLFHTNLYQLRKAVKGVLGNRRLVKHAAGQYHLDQDLFACDLIDFETVQPTGKAETAPVPAAEESSLEQALAHYRGEYMEGLDYAWIFPERERLNQHYLGLLDRLARFSLERGRYPRAAACLRSILKVNPLLEEAHALLMTVYARMGDRMAVLQQYETLTAVLEEELGIAPGAKTRELYYKLCGESEA